MTTKDFSIFDCDSHVVEPPEIWDEYVPRDVRAWVKTQFHFHTDTDLLHINGRVVPATRERSNAAEVGWPAGTRRRSAPWCRAPRRGSSASAVSPDAASRGPGCATWTRSARIR